MTRVEQIKKKNNNQFSNVSRLLENTMSITRKRPKFYELFRPFIGSAHALNEKTNGVKRSKLMVQKPNAAQRSVGNTVAVFYFLQIFLFTIVQPALAHTVNVVVYVRFLICTRCAAAVLRIYIPVNGSTRQEKCTNLHICESQ